MTGWAACGEVEGEGGCWVVRCGRMLRGACSMYMGEVGRWLSRLTGRAWRSVRMHAWCVECVAMESEGGGRGGALASLPLLTGALHIRVL